MSKRKKGFTSDKQRRTVMAILYHSTVDRNVHGIEKEGLVGKIGPNTRLLLQGLEYLTDSTPTPIKRKPRIHASLVKRDAQLWTGRPYGVVIRIASKSAHGWRSAIDPGTGKRERYTNTAIPRSHLFIPGKRFKGVPDAVRYLDYLRSQKRRNVKKK